MGAVWCWGVRCWAQPGTGLLTGLTRQKAPTSPARPNPHAPPQNSKPNTQHPTLNTQHPTLNTQHPTLNTQHSTPNTQHSKPNTQHLTPNTQHPPRRHNKSQPMPIDVIQLTRSLVDIPSVTNEEEEVGQFLYDYLNAFAQRTDGRVQKMAVEGSRFNVFAQWGETPSVTFSTHMDTVPPFIPSGEDNESVTGRGSCDAKGILAAMIAAIERLLSAGISGLGLLAVVGEERGSAGAIAAGKLNMGSRFLVNGEPTENQLALGAKGALRLNLKAEGRMAHSAYPELGESATLKLLDALEKIRRTPLPVDPVLGESTVNIGTINAGRAPNVIPDEAHAELLVRLVDDGESTRAAYKQAVEGLCEMNESLYIPAMRLGGMDGFATTTVSYTSDIPVLSPSWGKPFLLGPGTIHVAHTEGERVPKSQLMEAVDLYERLARELLAE